MEFAGSVTVGVISALNRDLENETLNLIQTDAAINPGNSGGALVNSQGQVIGINSAKISQTGVEGLGFAIAINDAKPIIDQLIMFGHIKGRPLLGITGQEVTTTLSMWYVLPTGIYLTDVTAGSGADKAGIKAGDVITKMAGKTVETTSDLDDIMSKYKAGDTVSITISRNGVTKTLQLTFTEDK
jgi:serine protease Do